MCDARAYATDLVQVQRVLQRGAALRVHGVHVGAAVQQQLRSGSQVAQGASLRSSSGCRPHSYA
jgi:hypothetical protein